MAKREVQEISASSMADIAFLLLIFFLVATTMNVDTGISRTLPPLAEQQQQDMQVNERNALQVNIDQANRVGIKGIPINISDLKDEAKKFILNPSDDPTLSEKVSTEIELLGNYPVSKGVISLQNDRATHYKTYIAVQNELTRAFNEIRDDLSTRSFGRKYEDLSEAQAEAIRKAIPLSISEAEPRNIGGN